MFYFTHNHGITERIRDTFLVRCESCLRSSYRRTQTLCCYQGRFLLSFFLLIPLSHENLPSLLLPGNKRGQTETLIQLTEWSQFVFNNSFGNLLYFTGLLRHQRLLARTINGQNFDTIAATVCCKHRAIYRSVAVSRWRYMTSQTMHLLLSERRCMYVFFQAACRMSTVQYFFLKKLPII